MNSPNSPNSPNSLDRGNPRAKRQKTSAGDPCSDLKLTKFNCLDFLGARLSKKGTRKWVKEFESARMGEPAPSIGDLPHISSTCSYEQMIHDLGRIFKQRNMENLFHTPYDSLKLHSLLCERSLLLEMEADSTALMAKLPEDVRSSFNLHISESDQALLIPVVVAISNIRNAFISESTEYFKCFIDRKPRESASDFKVRFDKHIKEYRNFSPGHLNAAVMHLFLRAHKKFYSSAYNKVYKEANYWYQYTSGFQNFKKWILDCADRINDGINEHLSPECPLPSPENSGGNSEQVDLTLRSSSGSQISLDNGSDGHYSMNNSDAMDAGEMADSGAEDPPMGESESDFVVPDSEEEPSSADSELETYNESQLSSVDMADDDGQVDLTSDRDEDRSDGSKESDSTFSRKISAAENLHELGQDVRLLPESSVSPIIDENQHLSEDTNSEDVGQFIGSDPPGENFTSRKNEEYCPDKEKRGRKKYRKMVL